MKPATFITALVASLCTLVITLASNVPSPREDFLPEKMDVSVDPGVDFFAYANAAWLRQHPIPATESAWGIGNVVREDF